MIVVADSSPLNYLIQIQSDSLLPELYSRVFVPTAVIEKLQHPRAPVAIASWLQHIPAWLEVRSAPSQVGSLEDLDAGEREAIFLAEEMHANLLLIDENKVVWQLGAGPSKRSGRSACCSRLQRTGWPIQSSYFTVSSRKHHFGLRFRSGNAFFCTAKSWRSSVRPVGDRSRLTDHMKTCAVDCTTALAFSARLKKNSVIVGGSTGKISSIALVGFC